MSTWEERMAQAAADRGAAQAMRPFWGPGLQPPPAVEEWLTEHALTQEEAVAQEAAIAGIGCACPGSPLPGPGMPCWCALWRMARDRALKTEAP